MRAIRNHVHHVIILPLHKCCVPICPVPRDKVLDLALVSDVQHEGRIARILSSHAS